jgi:hypothetical protein
VELENFTCRDNSYYAGIFIWEDGILKFENWLPSIIINVVRRNGNLIMKKSSEENACLTLHFIVGQFE